MKYTKQQKSGVLWEKILLQQEIKERLRIWRRVPSLELKVRAIQL